MRRVTWQVLFCMWWTGRTACLFCTIAVALTGTAQLQADGISSCCYIVNVHNHLSWATSCKEGMAWYSSRPLPSLWYCPSPYMYIVHCTVSVLWISKLTNNFSRKLLCFGPPIPSANGLCFWSLCRQIRARQRALTYKQNDKQLRVLESFGSFVVSYSPIFFNIWILTRTVLLRISLNPYTKLEEMASQKGRQAKTKLFRTYCKSLYRLILTDCKYTSRALLRGRTCVKI